MISIFKNLWLKIFSLILAVIVWTVIIALQQTPYQFTEELDIKPFNLSEQLSIVTALPKAKIKVITTKEIFQKLTKDDFKAYIDLENIAKGTHTLPVSVTPKIQNVTVASVFPSQLTLDVENVSQKSVPIIVLIKGSPNQGFAIDKWALNTDKAVIKGAESVLKKIVEAKAIINLNGTENENFQREITVQVFDQNGDDIKEISIEPQKIKIDLSLIQIAQQKAVGVKAVLKGSPKDAWVESVKSEPAIIEIKGDSKLIEAISYIETAPIDISDAVKSIEKFTPISLPKGISLVDENNSKVKITIEIKPY